MTIKTCALTANGLTFAADWAGAGDTVALLLHGFPECRQTWRRQLPALADLGWRAVAPDLRGYGGSSRPKGADAYRMEQLSEDVAALFDALGPKRRVLIGHDWGGAIAWHAVLSGLAVDGLVILNAPHPTRFREALRTWDQRRRSWYMAFFQLPWLPERLLTRGEGHSLMCGLQRQSGNFPPDLLETMRRNIVAPGAATAMLSYYRANVLPAVRLESAHARIEVPTLLIWGENDAYLSPSLACGLEPLVTKLTVHRLPRVSHWVQQDAPDTVNAVLAEWARQRALA